MNVCVKRWNKNTSTKMSRWTLVLLSLLFVVNTKAQTIGDTAKWYNKTHQLQGITIKKKREIYKRKDNPAVELMRKVITEKRRNDLKNCDYFRRSKYQKMTLAANNLRLSDVTEGKYAFIPGTLNQIEVCPYNNKLILPLTIIEKSSADIYRRKPRQKKEIVFGTRSDGINKLLAGDFITETLQDCFKDVDIYDNATHIFRHDFPSPIGNTAISFYRYFITDTIDYKGSACYQLYFYPNNGKDMGYSGTIYVLADSTYRLRHIELLLPRESMVNFVEGMAIWQDFGPINDGGWGIYSDDLIIEFSLMDLRYALVKKSRVSAYDFSPIPDGEFSEKSIFAKKQAAKQRNKTFWEQNRLTPLSNGERRMSIFIDSLKETRKYKFIAPILRLAIDNHLSTGTAWTPSKFDIGPLLSIVSKNPMDDVRLHLGGRTTANLSPHLFFDGFYGYGFCCHNHYYRARATYSFNKKEYLADEFPIRSISIASTRDTEIPSDNFLTNDKDNAFTSFRWANIDKMKTYNRQSLTFIREEENGLRTSLSINVEHNKSWGNTDFDYRATELKASVRYSPGEQWINTKRGRRVLNHDAPIFQLSHTIGLKDFIGGDHSYNLTEASVYGRLWLKSWGHFDFDIKGGAQWNSTPYYLLIFPAANVSYISQSGMFSMMSNMEFVNDRYASLFATWDLSGKLLNRLPLINRLGWRETIGAKILWGTLTSKNASQQMPQETYTMDGSKPYIELSFGIHNIFRFLSLEYVRRLNYCGLPTAHKQGIRGSVNIEF